MTDKTIPEMIIYLADLAPKDGSDFCSSIPLYLAINNTANIGLLIDSEVFSSVVNDCTLTLKIRDGKVEAKAKVVLPGFVNKIDFNVTLDSEIYND